MTTANCYTITILQYTLFLHSFGYFSHHRKTSNHNHAEKEESTLFYMSSDLPAQQPNLRPPAKKQDKDIYT